MQLPRNDESGDVILMTESVIPSLNKPSLGKWLGLIFLIVGGFERIEEQDRQLFAEAGLKLNRVVSTADEIS